MTNDDPFLRAYVAVRWLLADTPDPRLEVGRTGRLLQRLRAGTRRERATALAEDLGRIAADIDRRRLW